MGFNNTQLFSGTINDRWRFGWDLELASEDLSVDVESHGDPCMVSVRPRGHLMIAEHDNQVRFAQAFGEVRVEFYGAGRVAIDGDIANDCMGEVIFETVEPFYLDLDYGCPTAGVVRVTLGDGAPAVMRFTESGGLEFDFDGDGVSDKIVASCHDGALAQCRG